MVDINILVDLGLTEIEAKVYLTLLGLGSSPVGPIIKKTELHKATAYNVLERLVEKGLATFVKKDRVKYFDAVEPEKLLEIQREKEKRLESIIPELQRKKGALKLEQEASVYQGFYGIKSVCESILEELNPSGRYCDFGVSGLFKEVMGKYWYKWQLKKKYYGIKSKCIFDETVKKDKELLQNYFGQARFLSHEYYSPTDTMIFLDKVVLFIWTAKPPLAVVIKSKETAEGYKKYFDFIWKLAKK